MKTLSRILAFLFKCVLFWFFGLYLGLGSYDPSSSFVDQSWTVYILLYLPLAMGIEGLIIQAIEAIQESKSKEVKESEGSVKE